MMMMMIGLITTPDSAKYACAAGPFLLLSHRKAVQSERVYITHCTGIPSNRICSQVLKA